MQDMTYGLDIRAGQTIVVGIRTLYVTAVHPSPVYADTVQVYTPGPVADPDPMATLEIVYVRSDALVGLK